jgi:biopolymer transport protein ExbD
MGAPTNRDASLLTEINVTPLVDVVLVLLVIMMVTATAIASRTIPVELPRASTGESDATQRPLTVAIDEHGAMFVETTPVDDGELRRRAGGASSAVLAADGRARHEQVVHALEILRGEHVAKIAIVVRSDTGQR